MLGRGLGWPWALVVWFVLLAAPIAHAGQQCVDTPLSARQLSTSAATAERVEAALEAADRPIALLARVGNDLSEHGLYFSHAGLVLQDHTSGRWRVWHLLNRCGTDEAGLHVEGLFDYFAGHLTRQDAKIVFLEPKLEQELLATISDGRAEKLFQPRYNVLARPGSMRTQNSTAYLLEWLVTAEFALKSGRRTDVWRELASEFVPDQIHVAWGKRVLAGMARQNVDFTDHSVATRLRGDYPVVTVRSILRYLQLRQLATSSVVIRNGRTQAVPVAQDRPALR